MKPEQFVEFDRDQLAPQSLIEKREKRQQKFFQENVIEGSTHVVYKSHKGEEQIEIWPANRNLGANLDDITNKLEPFPPNLHSSCLTSHSDNQTRQEIERKEIIVSKPKTPSEKLNDLSALWNFEQIKQRFEDRIQTHLS